jgi:hypothetical protein
VTTANPTVDSGMFAARITMDGAAARRFRREALYEYRGLAESLDSDDMAQLLKARAELAVLDDLLTDLGWDREIADTEQVTVVARAALLKAIADALIGSAAADLKRTVDAGGDLDGSIADVQQWRDVLEQVADTATGEDL